MSESAEPDASIVRAVWKRADGSAAGPDRYSTQALAAAVDAVRQWRFTPATLQGKPVKVWADGHGRWYAEVTFPDTGYGNAGELGNDLFEQLQSFTA